MGCCFGSPHVGSENSDELDQSICIGKNKALIHEKVKWESEVPMTEGQLRSKRDEFWDTAPAFEGRKEIWEALAAAALHAEQGDFALAQAIIDGANISLPNGRLTETYDELGNRYQIPIYCLCAPANMVEDRSASSLSGPTPTSASASDLVPSASNSNNKRSAEKTISILCRVNPDSSDITLHAGPNETIWQLKQRLFAMGQKDNVPTANSQRWFFGGRILGDKSTVSACNLQANYVVQVISTPKTARGSATKRVDYSSSSKNAISLEVTNSTGGSISGRDATPTPVE